MHFRIAIPINEKRLTYRLKGEINTKFARTGQYHSLEMPCLSCSSCRSQPAKSKHAQPADSIQSECGRLRHGQRQFQGDVVERAARIETFHRNRVLAFDEKARIDSHVGVGSRAAAGIVDDFRPVYPKFAVIVEKNVSACRRNWRGKREEMAEAGVTDAVAAEIAAVSDIVARGRLEGVPPAGGIRVIVVEVRYPVGRDRRRTPRRSPCIVGANCHCIAPGRARV